jgi:uncharacterized membrane protein
VERLTLESERIAVSRGVAVILLLSSFVTGFLGMALLLMYEGSVTYYHVPVSYPALYVGVFNLSACAVCVVGGVALLKRSFFPLTLAAVFLLLVSGIAAPIAWSLDGYIWLNGLFLGAFQIVVSLIALVFLVARKAKK